MKIAIIGPGVMPVPALRGGAAEMLTTYLLEENEKTGMFQFDVYSTADPCLSSISYKHSNIIQIQYSKHPLMVRIVFSFMNHFYRFFHIPKMRNYMDYKISRRIKNNGYDYILVENNMNIYEFVYKRMKGSSKFLFHLHNDIVSDPGKSQRQCLLIGQTAECVFTASSFLTERFRMVCADAHVRTLTNCIDFDSYRPEALPSKATLRMQYGIGENEFVLVYCGRICREKGILELTKAFLEFRKEYGGKLLIVGKTWFGSRTEARYQRELTRISEPYRKDIVFTGYIDQAKMPEFYKMADVAAVPSKCREAFGMSALEAISMGVPVIATNDGGLKEILDNDCAILVPNDENLSVNLTSALRKLYQSKELREQMAKNAYERARSKFFGSEKYFELFAGELVHNFNWEVKHGEKNRNSDLS